MSGYQHFGVALMNRSNRIDHIRLTSHPDPSAKVRFPIHWGASSAYERGPMARLGGEPESVARVIEKALRIRNPRPRYLVTPSARLLVGLHGLLPDRMWDQLVASNYPRPGAG